MRIVGLIKGRHEMPVEDYIINFNIVDPFEEMGKIKETIENFLIEQVGIETCSGCGINQAGVEDTKIYHGVKNLMVYVTGLTLVTAELVKQCLENGISLTLMHFNSKTGEYIPQLIYGG